MSPLRLSCQPSRYIQGDGLSQRQGTREDVGARTRETRGCKLAGESFWSNRVRRSRANTSDTKSKTNLDIAPASASGFHARAASLANSGKANSLSKEKSSLSASTSDASSQASIEATKVYLEQVRLAILGMEQRMQSREDKLAKHIERAEEEGARFEEIRKQVLPASSA